MKKSTLLIPPSSEAEAVNVTVPLTLSPSFGAVTETVGGMVSLSDRPKLSNVTVPTLRIVIPTLIPVVPEGAPGMSHVPLVQVLEVGNAGLCFQKFHPPVFDRVYAEKTGLVSALYQAETA